jgi:hypothetical protein
MHGREGIRIQRRTSQLVSFGRIALVSGHGFKRTAQVFPANSRSFEAIGLAKLPECRLCFSARKERFSENAIAGLRGDDAEVPRR